MAIYAVGDVQGCYGALRRLLDKCRFDPDRDYLWLVGDLVNRGPNSLAVLRFVKSLGRRAVTVLGNHDLHLLVVAAGHEPQQPGDTLDEVLRAADRDELLDWLRRRKLMHVARGYAMVHGGLAPQWSIAKAQKLALEVETALRGSGCDKLLRGMYGDRPTRWSNELSGTQRLRVIVNAFTRMRICTANGKMDFKYKDQPIRLQRGYMPWFRVPGRRSRSTPVIFGHWASLGLYMADNVFGIDTGCVWGGPLTALRLDDRQLFFQGGKAGKRPTPAQ